MKDEEKKFDFLLQIIEDQKGGRKPFGNFSDQRKETQKKIQALKEELKVDNLEGALNNL